MNIVVIGGGLAGLLAALRLQRSRHEVVLIDDPLPAAGGLLGGFAKFSGAKFSLPPAGLGLVNVTGSLQILEETIEEVLAILRLPLECLHKSSETSLGVARQAIVHRQYQSYVLSVQQIDSLIRRLTGELCISQAILGKAKHLASNGHGQWRVSVEVKGCLQEYSADRVIVASGRRDHAILDAAGATRKVRKGIDIGVRVEFMNKRGLEVIRQLGADAKILVGPCRTFCLNFPGDVYRYAFEEIPIPGGVVAQDNVTRANLGLLYRTADKEQIIRRLKREIRHLKAVSPSLAYDSHSVETVIDAGLLRGIFPEDAIAALKRFAQELESAELIDWNVPHLVHFPLLDWHWPTYALDNSLSTTLDRVYVAGDLSGHARGLLQAAVSGWLCAEECLR